MTCNMVQQAASHNYSSWVFLWPLSYASECVHLFVPFPPPHSLNSYLPPLNRPPLLTSPPPDTDCKTTTNSCGLPPTYSFHVECNLMPKENWRSVQDKSSLYFLIFGIVGLCRLTLWTLLHSEKKAIPTTTPTPTLQLPSAKTHTVLKIYIFRVLLERLVFGLLSIGCLLWGGGRG
jgi:hypothetical protein